MIELPRLRNDNYTSPVKKMITILAEFYGDETHLSSHKTPSSLLTMHIIKINA